VTLFKFFDYLLKGVFSFTKQLENLTSVAGYTVDFRWNPSLLDFLRVAIEQVLKLT